MSQYVVGMGGAARFRAIASDTVRTSGVMVMNKRQEAAMRRKGHAIPHQVDQKKQSTLSYEDRIYALKRLFVIRNMLDPIIMMTEGGEDMALEMQLKLYIRGGTYRFPWRDDDPRKRWHNQWVRDDPRGIMPCFIAQTWRCVDGVAQEGDFANVMDRWCSPGMCREFLDFFVRVLETERDGGNALAAVQEAVATGTVEDPDGEYTKDYIGPYGEAAHKAMKKRVALAQAISKQVGDG